MLHGINPAASVLLPAIGASEGAFARFRDIFTSRDGSKIYVLTQTGGGNREHFGSNWQALRLMQQYESDQDDAFNPTYAWNTFKPLDEAVPIVRSFAPGQDPVLDMKVLTDRAIASLHRGELEEGARERREQLDVIARTRILNFQNSQKFPASKFHRGERRIAAG